MTAKDIPKFLAPWLENFLRENPFIRGAYLAGSVAELHPDDEIGSCSDIDIMMPIDSPARDKPGKIPYNSFIIEGTFIPWGELRDPERSMANYHVAHGLHHNLVLADQTGELTALCEYIAAEFPKPERIRARVDNVITKIESNLNGFRTDVPVERQCMGLLFTAGILTHAVLVAAMRNPTVRMRYRAVRDVLIPAGRSAEYEELMRVAGFADFTAEEAETYLADMASLFDAVEPLRRTRFPFTSDLCAEMRPTAVDDLSTMIRSGSHRETLFWLCATYTRLMQQAAYDAPELYNEEMPSFLRLMKRVGLGTPEARLRRAEAIRAALPGIRALCEQIITESLR